MRSERSYGNAHTSSPASSSCFPRGIEILGVTQCGCQLSWAQEDFSWRYLALETGHFPAAPIGSAWNSAQRAH